MNKDLKIDLTKSVKGLNVQRSQIPGTFLRYRLEIFAFIIDPSIVEKIRKLQVKQLYFGDVLLNIDVNACGYNNNNYTYWCCKIKSNPIRRNIQDIAKNVNKIVHASHPKCEDISMF